jgi:hypothetical protein
MGADAGQHPAGGAGEPIRIGMAALRYRSKSSEEQHVLDIKIWANACRDFPLWAVQKAADWWSRGARDGDDLRHFQADARLAIGHNLHNGPQ